MKEEKHKEEEEEETRNKEKTKQQESRESERLHSVRNFQYLFENEPRANGS